MKTATYFEPAPGTATTLYRNDGKTPYPYSHIIMRDPERSMLPLTTWLRICSLI